VTVETATAVTVKIPRDIHDAIQEIAEGTDRDFDSVATEMLTEATKMRRVPGIKFADAPTGRAPLIEGTGIKVYLVVRSYRTMGEDWESLKEAYDWLTDRQLRAALTYAEVYPEEIERRIQADEYWTPEKLWEKYPFMKPRHL
jgi:uncharacterized protein (DUF433 family)